MEMWGKVKFSRACWLALGCRLQLVAFFVIAAILAYHLGPSGKAHDSKQQDGTETGVYLTTLATLWQTPFHKENSSGLVYSPTPSRLQWTNASATIETAQTTAMFPTTTDINECARKPCQNGRCVNKDGGYKCTCSPGWTGQNCQEDINECTRNPCQHGRCVNKASGYKCTCSPGWTGQNCHQVQPCGGWTKYKNHCYKVMKERESWDTANSKCKQQGANLASIEDNAENNFIAGLIRDVPGLPGSIWGASYVWVGLHCRDGRLKWTDGSRVSYTNWASGEPNNDGNQKCVGVVSKKYRPFVLWGPWAERGQWDDELCWTIFFYVCKRPK